MVADALSRRYTLLLLEAKVFRFPSIQELNKEDPYFKGIPEEIPSTPSRKAIYLRATNFVSQ